MKIILKMKFQITVLIFIVSIFGLTGFKKQSWKKRVSSEDKWSGTVNFHEKKMGPTLVRHDWWMTATLVGNSGEAMDTAYIENTDGDKWHCRTVAKTELELGIDEEKGKYGITVAVPGCYGVSIDRYGVVYPGYGLTDETAIVINDQRLGTNHNVLSGSIVLRDSFPDGSRAITTYTWNLKKSN